MKCSGCQNEIEIGDHYITDTPSGFLKEETSLENDNLIAELLGSKDGKLYYCEDCTQEGGDYLFETYYGDEND